MMINRERFLRMMNEQATFGATPDGGVSRPALSAEDMQVRDWFRQQIEAHQLTYAIDGAGNQTGRLSSSKPNAKTLLLGSHFDSVPNGGRFDGALGMIAAFETLLSIKDANLDLPFHLEVVNLTDEEGTLMGITGSRAMIGALTHEELMNPRGGRERLTDGMARAGLSDDSLLSAQRDPDSLLGYLEVHIEQGTRLEEAKVDIGVVTSIVGIRSYWMTFAGEAAHAGTKPMDKRRDAFWGAAAFALRAQEMIMADFHPGVVNFGQIHLAPSAFNIVPAEVRLAVEFRHGNREELDNMETALLEQAHLAADEYGLELDAERGDSLRPAPMSDSFVNAIEAAAEKLGLSRTRLLSFAGHDAQSFAIVTNSAMFFVPSVDGISHNPKEYTKPDDCVNAANVMLQAVLEIAKSMG
ncbi:MAG: Zn-dependent hydrolase [Anaerolineae bacterium]|nr:Zn-dependent hydrolase [Anaerolineae bacterium]MDQ7034908.1 Zn-dependent hydrolase [Anaerolineae bacterium]